MDMLTTIYDFGFQLKSHDSWQVIHVLIFSFPFLDGQFYTMTFCLCISFFFSELLFDIHETCQHDFIFNFGSQVRSWTYKWNHLCKWFIWLNHHFCEDGHIIVCYQHVAYDQLWPNTTSKALNGAWCPFEDLSATFVNNEWWGQKYKYVSIAMAQWNCKAIKIQNLVVDSKNNLLC